MRLSILTNGRVVAFNNVPGWKVQSITNAFQLSLAQNRTFHFEHNGVEYFVNPNQITAIEVCKGES